MSGFPVHPDEMAAENVDAGVSPVIRKSCHFCRLRKIRCSGQRMCAACRARNLDCVYGREASKGRPRGSTSASTSVRSSSQNKLKPAGQRLSENPNHPNNGPLPAFVESLLRKESLGHTPSTTSTGVPPKSCGTVFTQDDLIATELEHTFRRISLDHPPQGPMLDGKLPLAESERLRWGHMSKNNNAPDFQAGPESATTKTVTYEKLFFGLVPGLVELVSARFGSLGLCHRDETLTPFFASSLAQDRSVTMFDAHMQVETPPKYNDHQVCQMIELWFFHHPLSFIVSKTLLLHGYRNGTHDEILLAAILAGASFTSNEAGFNPGQKLFQWVQSRLCHRKAGSLPLPSIQSLILVGWHELCLSRARRGYCYLEVARVAIIDFHTRLNEEPRTEIDWINGVDVGKVELELCQRMYWLTFALELWAALQKDIPFLDPMTLEVEVKYPPLNEVSSAVLTLDKESGNVATLGAQEKAMLELWPLSHIASTIESIYALYPRHTIATTANPASGWVSQTLPRLRHLLESPNNLSDVCQRIRDILADGLDKFQNQMGNHPSEIFTLSVYRTLIIHLLFPRPSPGASASRVTEATLNDAIRFITAFKDGLHSLDQPAVAHNVLIDSPQSTNPHMAVLGLDTCSRALHELFTLSMAGSPEDQKRMIGRQAELAVLARELHSISKHPIFRVVPTLSTVKKSLKSARQCFERRSIDPPPQASENKLWPGSLVSEGFPPISDHPHLLPMNGNGLEDTLCPHPPEFLFDGNLVNWNQEDWDGLQNRVMTSGITSSGEKGVF